MRNKTVYENVEIEVVLLDSSDIITASGAFDGDDDVITTWWNW